ncbi:reverse transcriptase domain-containing protein [Tanacetum coccineum]
MMKLFRSDDKFSQMLRQYESTPEFGSGSGGCGDDEIADDEDGGEDEEDEEDGDRMAPMGNRPRVSVKGQILADFIVERPEEDSPIEVEEELPEPWILFTDGSSCADGSGAGLILTNPEEMEFTYGLRFRFEATNNKAEYEALIAGLRIAEQMGVKNLQANVDSRLVANKVNRTYIVKETDMIQY